MLNILYQDQNLIAVDKPAGLLVHRTGLAQDQNQAQFLLQLLRDQIGQKVFPVHRLDRPTSGVIIFALSSEVATQLSEALQTDSASKTYWAIVRGWLAAEGVVDHPVKDPDTGKAPKDGITQFRCLERFELPQPVDRYPVARYSLVELHPKTGRRHQLRQHLKHLSHPMIGDTSYGKSVHNRFFQEKLAVNRLLLHAKSLYFIHPKTQKAWFIEAPLDQQWIRALNQLRQHPVELCELK